MRCWHGASSRLRVESGAGRQSVRAHVVEDPRRLFQGPDHRDRPDRRWVSLAGHRARLASFRWRPIRPVAAASGSIASVDFHSQPPRGTRRNAVDRHARRVRELEGRHAHSLSAISPDRRVVDWSRIVREPCGSAARLRSRLGAVRDSQRQASSVMGTTGSWRWVAFSVSKTAGRLWVGGRDRAVAMDAGVPDSSIRSRPGISSGLQASDGGDEAGSSSPRAAESARFVNGQAIDVPLPGTRGADRPSLLLRDRDGGLWIGTTRQGLVHVHQGRSDVFARSDGLSGDSSTHCSKIVKATSGSRPATASIAFASLPCPRFQ